MRRPTIAAFVVALGLAFSATAFAQPQAILRVAVDGSYPPYSMVDKKGRLSGFDIEMADEICKRLAAKCTKVQFTWDQILDAVKSQRADIVVASTSITDGRRRRGIAFSQRYYHTPAMFVRRKGDSVEGIWKALRGKTIGVQANTTHDQFVTSEFTASAKIARFKTLPQMVDALMKEQVDVILADAWALDQTAIKGKYGKKLEFTGPAYNDRRWFGEGIGVILPQDDPALKARIDEAIVAMREDGTYMQIANKYFSFDPYGN
ncbi:transporter substrate-binding domain-containing protein [Geminicoccus harenae]|uniref:transporter substrate-binding domain-containing protein n=1 Tax=Geminicoccus harenae TaxID=2498453 RepID=UPI00168B3318|nr:transporter substrate-binding domain-containing protein [Geminicoccus harenae]